MLFQVICWILLGIVIVFLLIDITPQFWDWQSRIHIGRFNNKEKWNEFITIKGAKWLNRTPKIKVTDNTRLIVIDMLKGNYTKRAIQHWQEASLLLGLAEYLKNKDDQEVENEIVKFLNTKFHKDGQWKDKPKHIDGVILAYAVMKLHFIDTNKYKKAYDYCWELIKEHLGEDGTVEYRKFMKNYRYVDTIGFICPFLTSYGLKYGNRECVDLAIRQITQYEKNGMLEKYYIPSHAYKVDDKVPLGLYGWGRGLGWFAIGLIDTWNEIPHNDPYKFELEEIVRKYAKAIMKLQCSNGSWNWTVTRGECNPDSSTTATLSWFLINAAKISDISNESLEHSDKAIRYLMKVTRRNGTVDFSQGDTKDIGVYSMLFNILPFTQGFCIRTINNSMGN